MPDGTDHAESGWSARFSILKADEDQGLVFGWAYQCTDAKGKTVVDHSGDITEIDEIEPAQYRFVERSRAGTERHERTCAKCQTVNKMEAVLKGRCVSCRASLKGAPPTQVATLVESVVFTKEKKAAMGLPDTFLVEGVWVGLRINRATEKGRKVWEGIKAGRIKMLSIGGSWKRVPIEEGADAE